MFKPGDTVYQVIDGTQYRGKVLYIREPYIVVDWELGGGIVWQAGVRECELTGEF